MAYLGGMKSHSILFAALILVTIHLMGGCMKRPPKTVFDLACQQKALRIYQLGLQAAYEMGYTEGPIPPLSLFAHKFDRPEDLVCYGHTYTVAVKNYPGLKTSFVIFDQYDYMMESNDAPNKTPVLWTHEKAHQPMVFLFLERGLMGYGHLTPEIKEYTEQEFLENVQNIQLNKLRMRGSYETDDEQLRAKADKISYKFPKQHYKQIVLDQKQLNDAELCQDRLKNLFHFMQQMRTGNPEYDYWADFPPSPEELYRIIPNHKEAFLCPLDPSYQQSLATGITRSSFLAIPGFKSMLEAGKSLAEIPLYRDRKPFYGDQINVLMADQSIKRFSLVEYEDFMKKLAEGNCEHC